MPEPQPAPHGRETVLLVEDEIAVRAFVTRVLRRYGYNVLEACDGPDARRTALAHGPRIDLLISDVVMPGGMNGRKVAEAVRVSHPEARVLYISGYPGDALAPHGVRPQQLNFLHKPFTQDALARKVREMLDADESSQLK
ncbi:response regulator [Gemmata sp. G18]|uniref:Response regulator n=1 Tax=Gemmata palustris TaxID=2822762 RepID=A0ABS5BXN5_9BACT|nr:response regulator [Gemmata palustris]MBP3958459.1 response regulator [Gemmata palustris]